MSKSHFENQPSLLVKIYGMFKIEMKNQNYFFLAMENLWFGLDMENQKTYDLKGSAANRFVKNDQNVVLLDTNFKLDRNSEPIPLKRE